MSRRTWLDKQTSRTVIVQLTTGVSLRGIVVGVYRDCVALHQAAYLGDGAMTMVDGEVIVPRERVAWVQVFTPSEGSTP